MPTACCRGRRQRRRPVRPEDDEDPEGDLSVATVNIPVESAAIHLKEVGEDSTKSPEWPKNDAAISEANVISGQDELQQAAVVDDDNRLRVRGGRGGCQWARPQP